jgi:anti-sigma factor RsiW
MVENGFSDARHVDEGTMHAWLDGALPAGESNSVAAHVASCEQCAAAAAEARGLIAASTRILSALDDVPGDVVPASARQAPVALRAESPVHTRTRSNRIVRTYASIAAVVAVAVGLTLVARERSTPAADRMMHQMTAAPEAAVDTVAGSGAVPQRAETSVASAPAASGARAQQAHGEARKPGASSQPASKSRAAPAPVFQGAAVAAGAARAASPSPDSLTVTGRVTAAATGLPLAGARVNVIGTDATAATDSTGTFKVSAVPAGTHSLQAQKLGFAPSRAVVTVQADRAANVTLALPSSTTALAEVITSGVTRSVDDFAKSPPEITGARVVSSTISDAGGSRIRRTTFQLDSGVTVTLVEIRSTPAVPGAESRSDTSVRSDTRSNTAKLMLRSSTTIANPSISWIAADSTVMILSGPLSTTELGELRKRIVP